MARGGANQKAVAAAEKKAANIAIKDAAKAREAEAALAADWANGSNARSQSKAESAAAKADELARKKREKAELLAAEEAAIGSGGKIKSSKLSGASKNKKKNDLALLEDALVGDAEKKLKEKKRLERLKKEREVVAAMEHERKAKEELAKRDPLLANTDAMIGSMLVHGEGVGGDSSTPAVGRAANVASMADIQATGVDAALSAMSLGGDAEDKHPEKRMKAAYKAYEEKMMLEMKQQYPGLKRQQYLDKIFSLWKKSPENPMNQL
jgi:hypothetical protein